MPTPDASYWSMSGLARLREHHPSWRLLTAHRAPFIVSFLQRVFIRDHRRAVPEATMLAALEDALFAARQDGDQEQQLRRPAAEYLSEWASDACGWLRSSYPPGQDEPVFDLTTAAERALEWIGTLAARSFVGTESRLRTVVDLLRQIRDGTEVNPQRRSAELKERRRRIDDELAKLERGEVEVLSDAAVRDRFQLLVTTARTLLTDLREVEQNFRHLDRDTRARIAQWDGAKGALVGEVLGHREAISGSDQGRSFQAFWEFLMSPERQEEFDQLLDLSLALPAVKPLITDPRLGRMRDDWLQASEHAQRTVARLSEQLSRFLDDRAGQEHRRMQRLLQEIERHASHLAVDPPQGLTMAIAAHRVCVVLAMDRPLFKPPLAVRFDASPIVIGMSDADASVLFTQPYVDLEELASNVRRCLVEAESVALPAVIARSPLDQGLAELLGYLRLASGDSGLVRAQIRDDERDDVSWEDDGEVRRASIPRVEFSR